MAKFLNLLDGIVWGVPALVLTLGVGLYLTIRLGFVQLTLFPRACRCFCQRLRDGNSTEGVSPFQALCTALAATVGTGNLVGVAGAICLGGPGAVFWIWVCGFLGMAVKFAEATLAVAHRKQTDRGLLGGPMYMMQSLGPGGKYLAKAYCLFGLIASFGVGNAAQINAVIVSSHGLFRRFGLEASPAGDLLLGIALAILLGALLFGGARRIGAAAEKLVPFAAAGYVLLCLGVLIARRDQIPGAFASIFQGVFSPGAVTGGMLGSAFQVLRTGCARGVFTNEAGMGTASIAHASAQVDHPCDQGLMGILEVFLDTILICTLTALVILVSGVPIPYGQDAGGTLTDGAFSRIYGQNASVFLALALCLFAVATVLGWGLYGARCAEYLFGEKAWKPFALAQTLTVALSAALDTAAIWQFSQSINGLMLIPNLLTLAALSPELCRLTKEYKKPGASRAGGGNYADFHQCQPL